MAEYDASHVTEAGDHGESSEKVRELFQEAKAEVAELGGIEAFQNGEWLLQLIQKSFRNCCERANADYFRNKYPAKSDEFIANKLIGVTARNAGLLGGVTGLAVSADEVIGIAQTVSTFGIGALGLPANVAIAVTAICSEALLLTRFQLQLVANLGKLYNVPLDPDDPEDILIILIYAVGGGVSEVTGKTGTKIVGHIAKTTTRKYISKQTLETLKRIGAKVGVKIVQRNILKYVVPGVSIFVGGGWNYASTRTMGYVAKKHFIKRRAEMEAA